MNLVDWVEGREKDPRSRISVYYLLYIRFTYKNTLKAVIDEQLWCVIDYWVKRSI
jgi:hypothetical protein